MSELFSNEELQEHINMSMEEFTKRYDNNKKADIVSQAIATLKLAAMGAMDIQQYCEG